MKIRIIIEPLIDGKKAEVYTVRVFGNEDSEYKIFCNEFSTNYSETISKINRLIIKMAEKHGNRDIYFENEGTNCVYKFKDTGILRLYCIRYGSLAIIVGGGDTKEPWINTYQEKESLDKAVRMLRAIDRYLDDNSIIVDDLHQIINKEIEIDIK